MRAILLTGLLLLAGCASERPADVDDPEPDVAAIMAFESFTLPAVHTGHGLYEPTIDVSADGVIYVSAHSTGVGVVPAPGYVSRDDGRTWANLPLAGPATLPAQVQGAAPLLSDEIFIVAGADGTAWGVDINLRDYIVSGWCGDGTEHCYYNPNAYDHTLVVTQQDDCFPVPIKDRPWAAVANGTLLLVNNPGGGPAQIGAMQVPPALYIDAGPVASGIQWNLCASSGGFIPGIPDIRDDGFFAVPQRGGDQYFVIVGNAADVMAVEVREVFQSDNVPVSQIGLYGQAAFDAKGTLYVAAMNNEAREGKDSGGIRLAFSDDDGLNFTAATFRFDQPVSSVYIDGNKNGTGALVNWGLVDEAGTDWYFGHLVPGPDGLALVDVNLAVDDGPPASRHVQGAALGPDGRAYMVMSDVSGNNSGEMAGQAGSTPLTVVVQTDGPTL